MSLTKIQTVGIANVDGVEYTAKMDDAVTATLNDWPTIPDTLA